MKIAVTYENGEVFQHFGHTEEFKIYDVEDGKVVSSEVISSNGEGHEALAGVLAAWDVDVLICGGIGGGAQSALSDNGIEICSGALGNTDEAVEAYLKGELESEGVNCDHHGEEHSCGHHNQDDSKDSGESSDFESDSEEGCGGCGGCGGDGEEEGCGGCGGGCGGCGGCHYEPDFDGPNLGKKVRAHYKGTFNDGSQFDSSYDRGEPLEFVCGAGQMIHGFDKAVATMKVGEIIDIHLDPSEAYGEADPNAIIPINISELPGSEDLIVGQHVYLQDVYGRPIPVRVIEKDDTRITFDANHEMAGKELNFKIELVEVLD
ncbi:MAG: FKBP-type peptidyl-prolyl cis-trans isomerase [Butyrivibrio sp.]|nr:FKBP-type peptidyl-prolyl cis-trans isomerase [Butyrivibrio sp.]